MVIGPATGEAFATIQTMVLGELARAMDGMNVDELDGAKSALLRARRVFAAGSGRSGLALRMAAMRWMHLGLTVYVAGEVTTPAIRAGDLLVVASGSGTTASAVQAAEVALKVGAEILAITTAAGSKLGGLATYCLVIPAATKQDHGGKVSEQYAGALFEQSVVLVMDVLFQQMWQDRGETAEQLWKRHANLE